MSVQLQGSKHLPWAMEAKEARKDNSYAEKTKNGKKRNNEIENDTDCLFWFCPQFCIDSYVFLGGG